MKENQILETFSKVTKQERPFPGIKLETEEDLRAAFALAEQITSISPRVAAMIAADPESTLKVFGIKLGKELSKRFTYAIRNRKKDSEKFMNLLNGSKPTLSDRTYFALPTNDKKLFAHDMKNSIESTKKIKSRKEANLISRLHFQVESLKKVAPAKKNIEYINSKNTKQSKNQNPSNSLLFNNFQNLISFSSTSGHDIVLQISEEFWSEMISGLIVTYWGVMALVSLIGGDIPTDAFMTTHTCEGRFFCFDYKVKLKLSATNPPSILLSNLGSTDAQMRFPCEVEIVTRRDESDSWGEAYSFSCDLINECSAVKSDSGSFLGQNLNNYFNADIQNGTFIVENKSVEVDAISEILVLIAAYDMVKKKLPEVPLSPELNNSRPFVFFSDADWSTLREPMTSFAGDSYSVTWGPNSDDFPLPIIQSGHQMTIGMSRAVFSFYAERNLPDVPIVDGNVHITSMNVEPRSGYIEVFGSGYVKTCNCWPNESFSYSIKIGLSIDNNGDLTSEVISSDVGATGFSATLLQLLAPFIGSIIVSIAEGIFGEEAAQSVEESLNMNINISEMFMNESALNPVEVEITTSRITPNGLFFDGKLALSFD